MIDAEPLTNLRAILIAIILVVLLSFTGYGCTLPHNAYKDVPVLRRGEIMKVTFWGVGAVPFGAPVGAFYYHSERGCGVISEVSAPPSLPKRETKAGEEEPCG